MINRYGCYYILPQCKSFFCMKFPETSFFFQHKNGFKGQNTGVRMFHANVFQMKTHSVPTTFCPSRLPPNTKLSPWELHTNVEINSQAQDKLPPRASLVMLPNARCIFHVRGGANALRRHHQRPAASGWGRDQGEVGVSLESNCNEPGTYPEQMAGRDVWRGRVHLTSRCQISPPRFEQYSYKRQCGMDGFIKVSLHSETFTAAAATWRKKGQSVCERWREGSLKKK